MHESDVYDNGGDADAFNTSNVQGWRVKLYELEPPEKGGSWVDRGTGYVRVVNSTSQFDSVGVYNEKPVDTQASLLVLDETAMDNILVNSPIKYNDAYERQGENIIMWRECSGDSTIDYALSFQESSGCQQIWKSIGTVQADARGYGGMEGHGEHLEDMGYMWSSESGMQMNLSGEYNSQSPQLGSGPRSHNGRILPPISEVELDDSFTDKINFMIEKLHFPHPSMKEFLSAQLLEQDAAYISKLLQIFDCLEETHDLPLIKKMSELFRNILFLNDASVLEYVVADPNILGDTEGNAESRAHAQAQYMHQLDVFYAVAGTQEYDSTLQRHGDYRAFLREKSQCVEVVSMQQHNWKMFKVQQQAQFLFRLKYLKDIILHPTVDDPYTSALSSMIVFTTSEICAQVFSESSYLAKVFQLILPDLDYSQYIPSSEPAAKKVTRNRHAAAGEENESTFATAGNKENIADGYDSDTTVIVDCKKGDGYDSDGTTIIGPQPLKEIVSEAAAERQRREGGLGAPIQRVVLAPSFINAIRFLRELFYMSKLLMMDKRQDMYRIFYQNMKQPFVEIVLYILYLPHSRGSRASDSLSREDICTGVSLIVEIISTFTIICPQFFRKMVLEGPVPTTNPMSSVVGITQTKSSSDESKWKSRCLLFLLIDVIVMNRCDTDVAILEQLGEALKVSFENNPSSVVGGSVLGGNGLLAQNQRAGQAQSGALSQTEKQDKDKFLCSIYDHYMTWFVAPLIQHTGGGDEDSELPTGWFGLKSMDYSSSHRILFDILIHCVQFHSYRMKYFMMRNNVIGKLVSNCFLPPASPTSSSSSFPATREMQLNAIRFVKTIISAKDDFYYRHIVKVDVMKPIFHSFQQISANRRDNLVSSSIYDLLFFVKTENIRVLICYIVENYSDCFRNLQFVDVFERLRIRYEQLMDNNGPSQANSSDNPGLGLVRSFTVNNSKKTKIKDLEEEEDYFFGEDESAESKPSVSPAAEPAPAVAKKARIFDSKTTSWSDNMIPAGSMRPAGQPLGKVVIFNRSNSLPMDRMCRTPEDLESGRKSASEGGSSGDRFSERRVMAAMKDSSAASAPPSPQSTIDISSLLSLYNDDDDEPNNNININEVNPNGEQEQSEGISALKFLNYKSVLSVPVHGDGKELPSEDLNLLPRSTSASAAEKKPIFDIFADDDASVPDHSTIQTQSTGSSPHSSRPSVPGSDSATVSASPLQQADESPEMLELALPPLKPKFEASDDDVSPIFSNRSHGSPHHHHSSSNSNNNSHSKSGKSGALAAFDSDRVQEADSIAGKGLMKVGSVTFSIKKKPRIL